MIYSQYSYKNKKTLCTCEIIFHSWCTEIWHFQILCWPSAHKPSKLGIFSFQLAKKQALLDLQSCRFKNLKNTSAVDWLILNQFLWIVFLIFFKLFYSHGLRAIEWVTSKCNHLDHSHRFSGLVIESPGKMTQTWNYCKYLSHKSHKPLRQTQTVHSNHTYSNDNECIYVFKQRSATYLVCSCGIITSLRKLHLIWHNIF